MSVSLNPTIEKFYLSILDYSGLKYENSIICHKDEKLGDITIDNKHLTLPYFENLKNPDNKIIFHPLNENYLNPETSTFNMYRKRLTLELNLKLSYLIINLITIASDIQLQQSIRSATLIDIVSNIGEADVVMVENFLNLIKASKQKNSEAFIFDIFLKKNGTLNNTPYAAIGKINFILPNEINKALEDKESGYKVYGVKLRKKDLIVFNNIFNIIFPDFTNEEKYSEGTDNKVFRYLNILLKTSFIIASRINDINSHIESLKSSSLKTEDCYSNLDWVNYLERLYELTTEIRQIPNNYDSSYKDINRVKVDETKVTKEENVQPQPQVLNTNIPVFNPNMANINNVQQPIQQPIQQQNSLSPEEIIRNNLNNPMGINPMVPNMPLPMQQIMPPQAIQQQSYMPLWVAQQAMQQQNTQPSMGLVNPIMQQPMMYHPLGVNQMFNQQPMVQSSGLQLNPYFLNR